MSSQSGHRPRYELIAARDDRQLTQEEAAAEADVSPNTWSRWELGQQGIRAKHKRRVAELFGVSVHEVDQWFATDTPSNPLPCWMSRNGGYVSLDDTVKTCLELWRWDVDPDRRHLVAGLPFAPAFLGEWLLSWAHDPSEQTRARTRSGPSVGMEDVQRIHEAAQSFDQMDRQFGGGLVRPAVVDYLNTQVAPLLRGRYSDEVGCHLLTAAALMTALAGWESFDLGDHGLAQLHYGRALYLAKAADDELTGARVLSILAQQAIDLQRPKWAVRLASAARRSGERAHAAPRVRSMLVLREATASALGVALSEHGDKHAVRRTELLIKTAEDTFAKIAPDDKEPGWISYFTGPEFTACAGYCWQLTGQYKRAAQDAQSAVHKLGSQYRRAVQFNQVHTATAQLGMGHLDAAIDWAEKAVSTANQLKSRRTVQMVAGFNRRLDPYGRESRVREFRAYLREELPAAAS